MAMIFVAVDFLSYVLEDGLFEEDLVITPKQSTSRTHMHARRPSRGT